MYLLDPGTKRDAHKTDLSYDEGEVRCFSARFLIRNMKADEAMQQITVSYFFLIVPNFFKEVLYIVRIQAPNMIHTTMVFAQSTIFQLRSFKIETSASTLL